MRVETSFECVTSRHVIPKIKNKEGGDEKTRQGIADVFAKFYEELYKGEDEQEKNEQECIEYEDEDSSQKGKIAEFTKEEIDAAIHRLKKGKARDSSGVRAEQLKICSEETREKYETSSMTLRNKRTSYRKAGAKTGFR